MSLGDVVSFVTELTGRFDKVNFIKTLVNSTVRQLSGMSRYPMNLTDMEEANNLNAMVVTIPLPARFQAVAYVRPSSCIENLEALAPDTYEVGHIGFYIAGNNLLIKLSNNADTIYFGWYTHPAPLIDDDDTNWLLDAMQMTIQEMVAYKLMGMVGHAESANSLERYSLQFLKNELANYSRPYGS